MQVVRFLYKPENSIHAAIEDDIQGDLADLGVEVIPLPVGHDEFNQADVVRRGGRGGVSMGGGGKRGRREGGERWAEEGRKRGEWGRAGGGGCRGGVERRGAVDWRKGGQGHILFPVGHDKVQQC